MRKILNNKTKRKLAFLLALLIAFSSVPGTSMGSSHAEDSEYDEGSISAGDAVSDGDGVSDGDLSDDPVLTKEFTVSWNAVNGGSVSAGDVCNIDGSVEVKSGEDIKLELIPDAGMQVEAVYVDGTPVLVSACTISANGYYEYLITDVTEDCQVEARFEKITKARRKVTPEELGIVWSNQNGETVNPDDNTYYGQRITLKSDVGNTYRLTEQGAYTSAIELNVSTQIDSIYVREDSPTEFGTEKRYELRTPVTVVIDTESPVIELADDEANIWLNESLATINLSGKVEDANPDYVVWSETELDENEIVNCTNRTYDLDNGVFSFSNVEVALDEETKNFYLYAVDKAGNCSQKAVVTVYRDERAAVITEIVIASEDTLNKLPYGTFTNSPLELIIKAKDVAEEGEWRFYTSGVKTVEIYAGDTQTPVYTKVVKNPVHNEREVTIECILPCVEEAGFSTLSEMRIRVIDAMGNASADYKLTDFIDEISSMVMMEQKAPLVEMTVSAESGTEYQKVEGENTQYWYSEIPQITYCASDMQENNSGSGLSERTVTLNGSELADYGKSDYSAVDTYSAVQQSEEGIIDVGKLSDMVAGENELQISFRDIAGNSNKDKVKIYLDNQEPSVTGFSIRITEDESRAQGNHQYVFGNFYNNVVEVTVYATDELNESGEVVPSAGLKSITLYLDGKVYQTTEDIVDGKATFLLPEELVLDEEKLYLETQIKASARDMVNNSSEAVDMTEVENGLDSSTLMIETVKPELAVSASGNYYKYNEKTLYTKDDVSFTLKVQDEHSGLQTVKVLVNGKLLVDKAYSGDTAERCTSDSLTANTKDAEINDQNMYEIQVVVTDNSGNQSTDTIKVYRDTTAPRILEFEMQADGRTQVSGEDIASADMPYGYFFRESPTVIIRATDGTDEADCGVKEIQYYTISSDGARKELQSVAVNAEGYATISIPAGFKGQIYACAYDRLMNASDTFVSPESIVVESYAQHDTETHIDFGKGSTSGRDATGLELYSSSVPVVVTVTDTVSGIQNVEWSVAAPCDTGKNESGNIEIDNDGNFASNSGGWEKTGEVKNLVTELKKTFVVSHNSNDITLYVKITDRAGNVTDRKCNFSIDTTEPMIEVTFDNMTPDSVYTDTYNSNRTATIIVQERNFDSSGIVAEITNADGQIPVLSEWSTSIDETNPDATVNTAKIIFADDGAYTLRITGRDAAGNGGNTINAEGFVIDKTMPQIAVVYNNSDVRNGSYYSQERTATIRITEHNFAPERVNVVGTASNAGEAIVFPAISDWSRDGDVYTATIVCDKDGLYQYNVEYADKAGNTGDMFTSEYYYVDLIAPVIEISGVGAFSANNGDVIPVISLSDSNYDYSSATIELTGANRGRVEPEGEFSIQEDGQIYTFVNFPKEQSYDDIYTLKVSLKDLAGNEISETITFSVNRFGSVYVFDESLKQIAGTYVKEEIDVKLTEVNIDSLEHDTIRVVVDANGNIRELVEGQDYTVRQIGGNGNWYRYEYVIDKSIFEGDGRYIVTLYSEDQAGNINQNIDEDKKAEISFGVDKTAPVVIPIDIESDTQYLVDVKSATVAVNDNLVLDNVEVFVGTQKCEYEVNGENYIFVIPEDDEKQRVTILATDLAGNTTNVVVSDVLVTTNLFVSWINNTPLFVASIAGMATVVGGVVSIFVMLGRRRRKDKK